MRQRWESPTLRSGGSYVSFVAPVPSALSQKIAAWNTRFGQESLAVGRHITVLVSECQDAAPVVARLQSEGLGVGAIPVTLGTPQSFAPVTEVAYLPLDQGVEEFQNFHRLLQEKAGASASPFPYIPHLTLSHGLGQNQFEEAESFYRGLDPSERSFTVEKLRMYSHREGQWSLLTEFFLDS